MKRMDNLNASLLSEADRSFFMHGC